MKKSCSLFVIMVAGLTFALPGSSVGGTYLVWTNGSQTSPYDTWGTAFSNVQDAVSYAGDGDTVLVTNGLYILDRGGAAYSTAILGLDFTSGITMSSVNGADVTIIEGNVDNSTRIRLARISHADALVEGFTFQGGVVRHEADTPGVTVSAGTIRDCVIRRCATYVGSTTVALKLSGTAIGERLTIHENAAGMHNAIVQVNGADALLRNSLVTDNHCGLASTWYATPTYIYSGRAVQLDNGTIAHCTIAGNYAEPGWLVTGLLLNGGTVTNSIIYHNRDRGLPISDIYNDVNVVKNGGTIEHSLMTPLLAGNGNLASEPQFVELARGSWASTGDGHSPDIAIGDYHLGPGSPAIDAGINVTVAVDRDGTARPVGSAPDIGAYEALAADAGSLRVSFDTSNLVAVASGEAGFKAHVAGADTTGLTYDWDFGNGQTASAGDEHTVAYNAAGVYTVRMDVSNTGAETAAWSNIVYRAPATVYASTNGAPQFPFASPAAGTPCFQHAIAAAAVTASATSTVEVGSGTYQLGGFQTVQLHKPIVIQGAGPEQTVLDAQYRCRGLEIRNTLAAFESIAISNGNPGTFVSSGASGVLMDGGTLRDCWVVDNQAGLLGGGGVTMWGGQVDRCRITDNSSGRHGCGVYLTGGALRNSLVARNESTVDYEGSAVYVGSGARVENCTIVTNLNVQTTSARSRNAGGILTLAGSEVLNTIAWHNYRDSGAASDFVLEGGTVTDSAAPELTHDPGGTGNITNAPTFTAAPAGDFSLAFGSSGVNQGLNADWMTNALDLAGNDRIAETTVDMGAYEYTPQASSLAVSNLAATGIGATNATMVGRILHAGDAEDPHAWICWDVQDKGTGSTGAWYRAVYMNTRTVDEEFSTVVTGLIPGSNYAYRCYVSNSTGTAWGAPLRSFTTIQAASVTNLGAAGIGLHDAWLVGQITDTGGEDPTCWFRYWQDGGALTSSVPSGQETGVFSNQISGLSPGTLYHYDVAASNVAGITWSHVADLTTDPATTYLVWTNGSQTSPYSTWGTAFSNVQDAVSYAADGDTVLVTNGLYVLDRGGAAYSTAILGLDFTSGITMSSVNGADVTIIEGNVDSSTRIRLVEISHADALVEGFTFQGGVVRHEADTPGVTVSAGTIRDCVIRRCATYVGSTTVALKLSGTAIGERLTIHENAAGMHNAIVHVNGADAMLRNSLVTDNHCGLASTWYVAPTYIYSGRAVQLDNGTLAHCTIAGNYAEPGWLVTGVLLNGGTVTNSIIYHNRDRSLPISDIYNDVNVVKNGGTIEYSITTPLLAGSGNQDSEPQFVNPARGSWASTGDGHSPDIAIGDYHLGPGSPAIDAGINVTVAVDRDGTARPVGSAPDIGAYEALAADAGSLRVSFDTSNLVAVASGEAGFTAHVAGADTTGLTYDWDFGNGQTASAGDEHTVAYNAAAVYTVRLDVSNTGAETAAWSNIVYRAPATVYASTNGTPQFPFASPAAGTPCLQHAIAAAVVTASATSTVKVGSGTYQLGAFQTVQLHKPIVIQGAGPNQTVLDAQYRCRGLEIRNTLAAFESIAISNGNPGTFVSSGASGVLMDGGTLRDCWVVDNQAGVLGGGGVTMSGGLVDRCRITDNSSTRHGCGVYLTGGALRNSLVARNESTVDYEGSAVYVGSGARVENCTIVTNLNVQTTSVRSRNAGGILTLAGSEVLNTIAWHNYRDNGAASDFVLEGGTVTYSAAPELTHDPGGTGNITNAPLFVARGSRNYRVEGSSPCINAGLEQPWMAGSADLAGKPRIDGKYPDIGAYEFVLPKGSLFIVR